MNSNSVWCAQAPEEAVRVLRFVSCLNGAKTLGEQRELMERFTFARQGGLK